MSRVYESLKGVVQETLQRGKGNSFPVPQTSPQGSTIDDKAEEFQRIVSDWIGAFRATVREREAVASSEVQRAEHAIETLKAENVALQAKLANAEELVHLKESSIKEVEQSFKGKFDDLEERLAKHEQLWAEREKQVQTLKSKLEKLKSSVSQIEDFMRDAQEVLASIEMQHAVGGSFLPAQAAKTPAAEGKPETNGTTEAAPVREIVPPKFFDRMTTALGHVIGSRAQVIVRDHVASLGESPDSFPKARVPELLELVSREISDENLKVGFREVVGDTL